MSDFRSDEMKALSDGIPHGLNNLGQTCYWNALLQCLAHTTSFYDYFTDDNWKAQNNKSTKVVPAFADFMKTYHTVKIKTVNPLALRSSFASPDGRSKHMFQDGKQHDTHV